MELDTPNPSDQPTLNVPTAVGTGCGDTLLCDETEEALVEVSTAGLAADGTQQPATADGSTQGKRPIGKPLAAENVSSLQQQQHLQSKRAKGLTSSGYGHNQSPDSSSPNSGLPADLSTMLTGPASPQHTFNLPQGALLGSSPSLRRFKLIGDLAGEASAPLPSTPLPSPAAAADGDNCLDAVPGSVLKGTPAPVRLCQPNKPSRLQPGAQGAPGPPLWSDPSQQDPGNVSQPPLPAPAAGSGPPGDPASAGPPSSHGSPVKHQHQQLVAGTGSPFKRGVLPAAEWMQSMLHSLHDIGNGTKPAAAGAAPVSSPPAVPPNSPCAAASPTGGTAAAAAEAAAAPRQAAAAGPLFYDHLLSGAGSPSVPVKFNHSDDSHMAIDPPPAASDMAPMDQGGGPPATAAAPAPADAPSQQQEEDAGHGEHSKQTSGDTTSGAAELQAATRAGGCSGQAAAACGSHQQATGTRVLSSPASRQLRFDLPAASPGGTSSHQQGKQPCSPGPLNPQQQVQQQAALQANLKSGTQPQKQQQRKGGRQEGAAGALSQHGGRDPGSPLRHGVFSMFMPRHKGKQGMQSQDVQQQQQRKQQQQQQQQQRMSAAQQQRVHAIQQQQQQQVGSPKLLSSSAWSKGPPAGLLAAGRSPTASSSPSAAAAPAPATRPAGASAAPGMATAAAAAAAPKGAWAAGSAAVRSAPSTGGVFRSSMRVVVPNPAGEPDRGKGGAGKPGAARAQGGASQQRQAQQQDQSAVWGPGQMVQQGVEPPASPHSGWGPVVPPALAVVNSQRSPSQQGVTGALGADNGATAEAGAGPGGGNVQLPAGAAITEPHGTSSSAAPDSPIISSLGDCAPAAAARCDGMDTTSEAPGSEAGAAAGAGAAGAAAGLAACSSGSAAPADAAGTALGSATGPTSRISAAAAAAAGSDTPAKAQGPPCAAAQMASAMVVPIPVPVPLLLEAVAPTQHMTMEVTQQASPGATPAACSVDAAAGLGVQVTPLSDAPNAALSPLQLPPALRAAAAAARQAKLGPPPGFEGAAGQGWAGSSLASPLGGASTMEGLPPGLPMSTAAGPGPASYETLQLAAGGAATGSTAAGAGGNAAEGGFNGSTAAAAEAGVDRMDTDQVEALFEYPPVDAEGLAGVPVRHGAARRMACSGGPADGAEEEEDDVPPGFPGAPRTTAAARGAGGAAAGAGAEWVAAGSSGGGDGSCFGTQPCMDVIMTEAAQDMQEPCFHCPSPLITADLGADPAAAEVMEMDLDLGGGDDQGGGTCEGLPPGEDSWCSYSTDGGSAQVPLAPGADMLLGLGTGLDPAGLLVEESYTGPRMAVGPDGGLVVTEAFVLSMVDHFRMKQLLHARYAWEILRQARELQVQRATLVDVSLAPDETIRVCGDVHGQFFDLLTIFARHGNPSPTNPYLFNGDLVDRGSYSAEVVLTLFAWQLLHPGGMYINRGNHEARSLNCRYGFSAEMKAKYGKRLLRQCQAVFNLLPLATCINHSVLVVHGGLPGQDGVTLDDIRAINRNREPEGASHIMYDLLWSDPKDEAGKEGSLRGAGVLWGPDATERFLQDNGLSLIVRSHQHKERGWEQQHGGKVLTVFSAPNYCGCVGNLGAVLQINGRCTTELYTFEEVAGVEQLPSNYYFSEEDMHDEMEDHRREGDRWSSGDAGSDLVGGALLDPDVTEYDFAEFEGEYSAW